MSPFTGRMVRANFMNALLHEPDASFEQGSQVLRYSVPLGHGTSEKRIGTSRMVSDVGHNSELILHSNDSPLGC